MQKSAQSSYAPSSPITSQPLIGTLKFSFILLIFIILCSACGQTGESTDKTQWSQSDGIPDNEDIVSIQIEPAAIILKAGQTMQFSVHAVAKSGHEYLNPSLNWQVDDSKVAALQSDRQVYAVAEGTATIQAQWQGITSNPVEVIVPGDPMFEQQWHLKNIGQNGGTYGEDINVEPVWRGGHKGQSVLVAVVDDGLEAQHADLAANFSELSWNYADFSNDPSTGVHGTAVAGLVAARDSNGIGGLGVAPRAQLAGYNLLENYSTINEADAMLRHADQVAVSNNSWGAVDGTGELFRSYQPWREAVQTGATQGRQGKGVIYVWAAGNGGRMEIDNSNYDGQANNRYVMAVAAVGDDGVRAGYSEQGANLWLAAPSRGYSGQGLLTTDRTGERGFNASVTHWDVAEKDFTRYFSGTSAAAPVVSGVAALVVDANPALTWRDVRLILARTARVNDPNDADWQSNQGLEHRYPINHKYGFGVPDASKAVALAQTWQPVSQEYQYHSPVLWAETAIPDNDSNGIISNLYIPEDLVIEFVEVVFDASDHGNQGDLSVSLTAPSGTQSILAQAHSCRAEPCSSRYINWVFGDARHLGESSLGNWQLHVNDTRAGYTGSLRSWSLRVYGRKNG